MMRKGCKLCIDNPLEAEEHFLLKCSAFSKSRQLMWLNIQGNLVHSGFENVWLSVQGSAPSIQLLYLLGKMEADWGPDAASIIDSAVRQYLLRAAHDRKLLLAAI
jgi:hypothetical protein